MSRLDELIKELCPNGVEYKKLGDIATISRGGSFQKKDFVEYGIPCIHYGQIYTQYGLSADKTITYIDEIAGGKAKYAGPNDIVMAVTKSGLKKKHKVDGKAEADRFFNYPYNALEEAIVNAVLHKNYKENVPVEIRIYLDQIQIINFPGSDRYIDMEKFAAGQIRARRYRNPKIGEFFKEIDLFEKKSTGISKILRELKRNGSPLPEFETDMDRTYLMIFIKQRESLWR